MPTIAVLSDVHSNLNALVEVLRDLEAQGGADRIYCLGDLIGYGPRPLDCLGIARERFHVYLRGNHEHAVLYGANDFNAMALRSINWTRAQIIPDYQNATPDQMANWTFIAGLPEQHREGESMLFVHGAPQDPVQEYILPTDVDPRTRRMSPKLQEAFRLTPWLTFCGHSHFPGLFGEDGSYLTPTLQKQVRLTLDRRRKYIVNVGSVGQPRDGDNRACYVIFSDGVLTWRRVHYDIQDMHNHIVAISQLDVVLGERLFRGE